MSRNRSLAAAAVFVAVGLALVGCTGEVPDRSARDEQPAPPAETVQLVPGGTAEQNLPYFTETLRAFSQGDQPVRGVPVVDAVVEAGFDRSAMQVSFDESKTNLVADNIFVSVRFGEECVIGQIVTADRTFFSSVEPAVGPGKQYCLIGQTRVIDWE